MVYIIRKKYRVLNEKEAFPQLNILKMEDKIMWTVVDMETGLVMAVYTNEADVVIRKEN